eukprot:Clim_evm2s235 gene=Clim_evmTU2s235
MQELTIPTPSDFHTHLRQGDLTELVVPMLARSGMGRVQVMPNLKPPITSVAACVNYRNQLKAIDSNVEYIMSLYLGPELSPEVIKDAADKGIKCVKSYPRGVTTGSEQGIEDYKTYYPVFKAMEECNMILNLHGEIPTDADQDICVLSAEAAFLPHLEQLHRDFPNLKMVLEHATTADSVECVKRLGPNVACTITAHHLDLFIDMWAGRNHNFCKPVAKHPHDRKALQEAVKSGNPKFFLGSDSAPHPKSDKEAKIACAGVFTTPHLLCYLADTFERLGCLDKLQDFTSTFGSTFYDVKPLEGTVTLVRQPCRVPEEYPYGNGGDAVVPYRAGETLNWSVKQ